MTERRVKIAETDLASETAWADHYFLQWQQVTQELGETRKQLAQYQKNFQLKEQLIADLRTQISQAYIAGMNEQRRLAAECAKTDSEKQS